MNKFITQHEHDMNKFISNIDMIQIINLEFSIQISKIFNNITQY